MARWASRTSLPQACPAPLSEGCEGQGSPGSYRQRLPLGESVQPPLQQQLQLQLSIVHWPGFERLSLSKVERLLDTKLFFVFLCPAAPTPLQ